MMKQKTAPGGVDRRRRAFTLIELLVVISIIAVLAAILFPVFARARENARRSSCLSNMKQLGLAFMQYTQDYDEQLPINGSTSSYPGSSSWDVAIAPYTGVKVGGGASPAIFRCPSDTAIETKSSYAIPWNGMHAPGSTPTFVFGTTLKPDGSSYSANFTGVKLASIPHPATTIMLAELPSSLPGIPSSDPLYVNNSFGNYSNSYVTGPVGGTANKQDKSRPGKPIHLDGWNYLFSDGHVKWMRPEQTMIGVTNGLSQRVPGNMWARIKE